MNFCANGNAAEWIWLELDWPKTGLELSIDRSFNSAVDLFRGRWFKYPFTKGVSCPCAVVCLIGEGPNKLVDS
jgi:hypothetical protein